MPATDSPAIIVARFLRSNNYTESYNAFITEAGLPEDAGSVSKGDLTLEVLLEEKRNFDVSVKFEKLGVTDGQHGWTAEAPEESIIVSTLPTSSNILSVTADNAGDAPTSSLMVTTADQRLHVLDAASTQPKQSLVGLQDSPILSCTMYGTNVLLTGSMSGQLVASNPEGQVIEKRRDHSKYVVKVATYPHTTNPLIATAGWDGKILIYRPKPDQEVSLGEPAATITLPSKPESIAFVQHPDNSQPLLIVSRTDSSSLHYYTTEAEPRLLGKQNLAPHSNAWVAFTPSAIALCPTDPSLLAIATSTIPHMKLLVVRLLIPPFDQSALAPTSTGPIRTSLLDDSSATETQASQARAALAIADREHAAIIIHCTTMASQTAYSTPAVAWRPDGTGIWVNGDDGVVRGIEASSGKVVSTLHGHEAGSKVRCLWAGRVQGEDGSEEVLVSGGFDQKLIIWKPSRV